MRHASPIGLIAATLLFASFLTARGEDAAQVVSALFGEKIKKVEATATRSDDVALAAEMLEASRGETVTPAMRAAICEKASELAMRDTAGFATAIEAMKLWPIEGSAAEQAVIGDKQSDLLTRIFQTGKPADRPTAGAMLIDLLVRSGEAKLEANQFADAVAIFRKASTLAPRAKPDAVAAVKSRLELATYRERTGRQIEQLRGKLLESRADTASAEALIKLLILDQQDAKAAEAYLDAAKDEALKKIVALLNKPADDLSATEAMTLAEWFMAAGKTAQGLTLGSVLSQAKAHYEQVLARSEADNLSKTKASLQVKDIAAKLEKMEAPPVVVRAETVPRREDKRLQIHYLFDSVNVTNSTIKNLAAEKWNGKLTGGKFSTSEVGPAMVFDGIDNFVDTGFGEQLATWTFALWVMGDEEPRSQLATGPLYSEGAITFSWHHPLDDYRGKVATFINKEIPAAGFGKLEGKRWYHLAATYDGKTLRAYSDGKLQGETKGPGGSFSRTNQTMTLGCHSARRELKWGGSLSEFRLYNSALSDEEIKTLAGIKPVAGKQAQRNISASGASSTGKPSDKSIDLLKIIDIEKNKVAGRWEMKDGKLIGYAGGVFEIPYIPPAEYDVTIEFDSDSTLVALALTKGEQRFWWGMKGWSHTLCGIRWIDGADMNSNPTTTNFPMSNGTRYSCEVRVRNDKFTALIDGKTILDYKTNYKNIEDQTGYRIGPGMLGLFVNKHSMSVFKLEVKEVTGRGKVVK